MKTRILIPHRRIQRRIRELARRIDHHYRGREIVVVGVLTGGILFLADLVRRLKTPVRLDFIAASSYGNRRHSSGRVIFHPHSKISLHGAHVLLVDDILDTGLTLRELTAFLRRQRPSSIEVCVLLRKMGVQRKFRTKPRFIGFDIPKRFIFGYGLDYDETRRNLPDIVYCAGN
jgi:hypoxanthine phosphoribosyltransferase